LKPGKYQDHEKGRNADTQQGLPARDNTGGSLAFIALFAAATIVSMNNQQSKAHG
jgi:hypothetical protein